MESLRKLVNKHEIASHFNTNYNGEFTKSFPIGAKLSVPFPKQYIGHDGIGYDPEPIIDRSATVYMDRFATVDLEWDAVERALNFPRSEEKISSEIIGPMTDRIKQKIESACALHAYRNTPNVVGALQTNPTTFDQFYGAAAERMEMIGCPMDTERTMVLWPTAARALKATTVSQFNPVDEVKRIWRKGAIGEKDGFDTYSSMSLYQHTAGTWAGAVTVTTTSVQGATSLAVTCTTGDTFLEGDTFSVAACNEVNRATYRSTGNLKHWGVLVSTTGAASAATIQLVYSSSQGAIIGPGSPYQNCDALPLAGAALTLFPGTTSPNGKAGTQNLAFTDDAFALVSVPLDMPRFSASPALNAEMSSHARDPNSGMTINFLRQFDGKTMTWINRMMVFYGLGNFYNDVCAVRCLGA